MTEAGDDSSELSRPTTNTPSLVDKGCTNGKNHSFISPDNNTDNSPVGSNKSGTDNNGLFTNNNKNDCSSGGSGDWGFGDKYGRDQNGLRNRNDVDRDNKGCHDDRDNDYRPRGKGGRGGSRGGLGNRREDGDGEMSVFYSSGGGFGRKCNGDGENDKSDDDDNNGFEGSADRDYQPRGRGGRGGSRGSRGGFGNRQKDGDGGITGFGGSGGGFDKKFNDDREYDKNGNDHNNGFEGSADRDYQPRGRGCRGGSRGGFKNHNEDGDGGSIGFSKKFNSDGDGDGDNGPKPSRSDGRRSRNKEKSDGNDDEEEDAKNFDKPPPVTYIPPEISMDDDKLFNGVDVGQNFSKYDEINAIITGVNFPGPIDDFKFMGLKKLVMDNIVKSGYTKPTPVQKSAMPIIMNGRDLMACAQTGSGKTAAFMVPIINDLLEHPSELIGERCEPHCVVLSPTHELAVQIWRQALKFSKDSDIKCSVIYGGVSTVHQGNQVANGCHILVATPGRLVDFVERCRISFASIRYVVFDEADRMLNMGFLGSIRKMMNHETMVAKEERQTLMFSATFDKSVQSLAAHFLDNYLFLTVGIVGAACSDVEQSFYEVTKQEKRPKLIELLGNDAENPVPRTIIFVETKMNADFLAAYLAETKIPTTSIHGDRMQQQREEALSDFISGRMPVLVATAVAGRGLDINDVAHVINYDMPKKIDEYVHRIGRTGRIGNRGKATSFLNLETDSGIIDDLVWVLKSSRQKIPDWLTGGRANFSTGTDDKFGGHDV